jgi:hypothetical protein
MAKVTILADARRCRLRLDALSFEERRILRFAAASKGVTIYQYAESLVRRKKEPLKQYLKMLGIVLRHPEVEKILKAPIAARANG